MEDHDTSFLSLATAAVAGALFMYWVEARRRDRFGDDRDAVRNRAMGGAPHPTRPAKSAWNEQGV
jgi:hypothetical protein